METQETQDNDTKCMSLNLCQFTITSQDLRCCAPGTARGAAGAAGWRQVVVIGVGNILLKDEGVGVWVVRELVKCSLAGPAGDVAGVVFIEAGVAGLDLLPVVDGARHLIIVDAMIRGGRPGSVYQLDAGDILGHHGSRAPQASPPPGRMIPRGIPLASAHDIGLPQFLWYARQLGLLCPAVIFGIEPATIDYGVGLSDELKRALPEIVEHIAQFIAQFPDNPVDNPVQ